MVLRPVSMTKIAIMGLRKNQQTAVSVLHDMEVLQLEPLSKDISAILKSERDDDLSRQVSDELLRVRALLTVLPPTKISTKKRFDSVDEVLQIASTIDIDESVAGVLLNDSIEAQKVMMADSFGMTEGQIEEATKNSLDNFFLSLIGGVLIINLFIGGIISLIAGAIIKRTEEDQY